MTTLLCISFSPALAFLDTSGEEGRGERPFDKSSNIEVKCLDRDQKTVLYLKSLAGVGSANHANWIYRSNGRLVEGIEDLRMRMGMPTVNNRQSISFSIETPADEGQVETYHYGVIQFPTMEVTAVFDYRIRNRSQRISDNLNCTAKILPPSSPIEKSCDGEL